MLTNENLLMERYEELIDRNQRIYRFSSGYGLSLIDFKPGNKFAWSVAIIKDITDDGSYTVVYTTPLSKAGPLHTDAETNAFIAKAKKLFDVPEYKETDNE